MEGFKKLPKQIACFKEGGSVQKEVHNFTKRDRKNVEPGDLAQDKKLIKKAFKQHDEAEHDKKPTEIKLKKGGRAKKDCGTVRKYKTGGAVTNVYEAKKKSGDLEAIKAVKDIKPVKAAAPSKAVVVSKNTPAKFCGGKSVKKMADGGATFENNPEAAQAALDTQDNVATRNMIMNPARKAKKYLMDKLSGLSPMNAAVSNVGAPPVPAPPVPAPPVPAPPVPAPAAAPQGMLPAAPPMKKGGKAKKK